MPWKANKVLASSLLVLILTPCFISSCTHNKKGAEEVFEEQQSTHPASHALGTFGYLDEIKGCSCYLSMDSIQFRNQEFVYAEKYGLTDGSGFGIIMLDGKSVRLEVLDYENDIDGRFRKVRLGNKNLEVWVNLEINNSLDQEVLPVNGNIHFHLNDQTFLIENIVGVCAC